MPLLPLLQPNRGVAGRFELLQEDAVTALLVRQIVSPFALVFAVMISPTARLIDGSVQLPAVTFTTLSDRTAFL